jgi:hypothetical protein
VSDTAQVELTGGRVKSPGGRRRGSGRRRPGGKRFSALADIPLATSAGGVEGDELLSNGEGALKMLSGKLANKTLKGSGGARPEERRERGEGGEGAVGRQMRK